MLVSHRKQKAPDAASFAPQTNDSFRHTASVAPRTEGSFRNTTSVYSTNGRKLQMPHFFYTMNRRQFETTTSAAPQTEGCFRKKEFHSTQYIPGEPALRILHPAMNMNFCITSKWVCYNKKKKKKMGSKNVSCTAQAKWKNYMQKGCVSFARQHLAGRSICRVGPFGTYCKELFPFCCTMCFTTNRRHHKTRCFRASGVS